MGNLSKIRSPLHVQECRASLFDEDTSRVSKFHTAFLVSSEQIKSSLFTVLERWKVGLWKRPHARKLTT
jgi:hypothetical protein